MVTINSLSGGKTSAYIAAHYPADHDIFSLVRIEDPTKLPYILEANRSGLCFKSLEIDAEGMTITKVREARIKRAFTGDVEEIKKKIR